MEALFDAEKIMFELRLSMSMSMSMMMSMSMPLVSFLALELSQIDQLLIVAIPGPPVHPGTSSTCDNACTSPYSRWLKSARCVHTTNYDWYSNSFT